MKVSNALRYLYLNPIEGVLISYKNANQFPHRPNLIIQLKTLQNLEYLQDRKWYLSNDFHYFSFTTNEKDHIYFDSSLDVVLFWVRQIKQAQQFYQWYQRLIKVRYQNHGAQVVNTDAADRILNQIMQLQLPEIDRD